MEPPTDEALLKHIGLEDEQALALFYDRYGRLAYSLAYRILGDSGSAEDVVQEAFLNVWRMATSFNGQRGSARTWLLSVVHHRAIDATRQRRRRPSEPLDQEGFDHSPIEVAEVWTALANRLDRQALEKALARIPQAQQEVIQLAYFDGYTHRELAGRLLLPLGTVKSRIRKGLEKLRVLLRDHERGA